MKRLGDAGSLGGEDDVKRLKEELARQQGDLNKSFLEFCSKTDPLANWVDAMRDYEQYSVEIASRYNEGVSSTDGGALYSFGSGDCGQLGHGVSDPPVEEEETVVVRPKKIKAFANAKNIRLIVCGGLTNGVVDSKGLWTWGCADDGALGREGDENLPTLVSFPFKIIVTDVAFGESHGTCVSLSGQAFLWGAYRDKEGKTFFPTTATVEGDGKQSGSGTISKRPMELKGISNIVACSSGANHTLYLTGEGDVYSLGLGEQNQLGRRVSTKFKIPHPTDKDAEDVYDVTMLHREHLSPQKISLNIGSIRSIGCGAYHSFVISSVRFRVHGCGLNQYRQIAAVERDQLEWTHLTDLDGKHVSFIRGGEHYSVALAADGSLYTWGRADQGQLGRNADEKAGSFDGVPGKVSGLPPIASVYPASSHVLAVTRTGFVYSWGFGEMLQLGHGETEPDSGMGADQRLPKKIDFFKDGHVYRVSAGAQHSCVLVGKQ